MKSNVLSIVVGTEECIAKCPFCVSCEKVGSRDVQEINKRNFEISCRYAEKAGVTTIELTSRGEPLLYPDQIKTFLEILKPYKFPFIELQTNAVLIGNKIIPFHTLIDWYNLGLTHIAISTVSISTKINAMNYFGNAGILYPDIKNTIDILHQIGFTVRLVCIMCNDIDQEGYVCTPEQMQEYIDFASKYKVEQVTFRPVNNEYRRKNAHEWCETHSLSSDQKKRCMLYCKTNGTLLQIIPNVGEIYDINGQNVMLSYNMTKYSKTSNAEESRNLIFFPDGHLRYRWEQNGAILL